MVSPSSFRNFCAAVRVVHGTVAVVAALADGTHAAIRPAAATRVSARRIPRVRLEVVTAMVCVLLKSVVGATTIL